MKFLSSQSWLCLLLQRRFSCAHRQALADTNEGYCPECGVYLKKYFYIVRCKCCDIKREGQMRFKEIAPSDKYCTNCGAEEFYVEKLEHINFTDVRFAIHQKECCEPAKIRPSTQVWVEETTESLLKPQKPPQLRLIKCKGQSA